MTRDDIIMALYQNINVDVLIEAKRDGNLLRYYGIVADGISEALISRPVSRERASGIELPRPERTEMPNRPVIPVGIPPVFRAPNNSMPARPSRNEVVSEPARRQDTVGISRN